MRKKKLPHYDNVEILSIVSEGKSMAKIDGIVVFVPFAVPGDIVNIQITKKQKQFMEGYITETISYSSERLEPLCPHFGVCGGCKWQPLSYLRQLEQKSQQVEDQLIRIGKLKINGIEPIIPSPKTEYYRNKLEYTFTDKRWLTKEELGTAHDDQSVKGLGFHVPGKFDKVVHIDKCILQSDPSNEIRNFIYRTAISLGYRFFNLRDQVGLLRTLFIRTTTQNEIMVVVVFAYENREDIELLLTKIRDQFPFITSLQYVINNKRNDSIYDLKLHTFSGKNHIMEQMNGLQFKIQAKSFYQTNSQQACTLYSKVLEYCTLTPEDIVYDLYTGTGTIACFLAKHCKKVIGVECVEDAIIDAKENTILNQIVNVEFYTGDVKEVLSSQFVSQNGTPNVIVIDPPRAGIHPDVIEKILTISPQKIVYVSCNPATQARDLAMMKTSYNIIKVQPIDMFPHTHHVENIVLLQK